MNNKIYDALNTIKADDLLIDKTKGYISEKLQKKAMYRHRSIARRVIAFTCMLLILFLAGGYTTYFTEAATISVDVNPSIEISLNYFDRVISVEGFGDEAENIIKELNIKNMKYNDAIVSLMNSECMQPFVSKNCTIMLTVVAGKNKENKLQMGINNSMCCRYKNVECYSANKQYVEKAHEEGLSVGKYRAYLELLELDPNIKIDEIKDMSMSQIQSLINSYKNSSTLE